MRVGVCVCVRRRERGKDLQRRRYKDGTMEQQCIVRSSLKPLWGARGAAAAAAAAETATAVAKENFFVPVPAAVNCHWEEQEEEEEEDETYFLPLSDSQKEKLSLHTTTERDWWGAASDLELTCSKHKAHFSRRRILLVKSSPKSNFFLAVKYRGRKFLHFWREEEAAAAGSGGSFSGSSSGGGGSCCRKILIIPSSSSSERK